MTSDELRNQFAHYKPKMLGLRKEYAVLVPLVKQDDSWHILYEVRAHHMRRQPNEVCFPGGRMESGETAITCALRETQEELGIAACDIEVIGELDFLHMRSECLMYPVLAIINPAALEHLHYNPDEVADTFSVPVSYLQDNPPTVYRYELKPMVEDFPYDEIHLSSYPWVSGSMEVPLYHGLPYPLWGMTARITHNLIENFK